MAERYIKVKQYFSLAIVGVFTNNNKGYKIIIFGDSKLKEIVYLESIENLKKSNNPTAQATT